jgi:hypothetical protein
VTGVGDATGGTSAGPSSGWRPIAAVAAALFLALALARRVRRRAGAT